MNAYVRKEIDKQIHKDEVKQKIFKIINYNKI